MTETKPLRIGVDLRPLLTGQISGIEQYTISVLSELLRIDHDNTYVLFYVRYQDLERNFLELLERYPILKSSNVEIRPLKWVNIPLLLHATFKPLNWPKADLVCGGLDVMWMPSPMLLPVSRHCAKITTVHDLIFQLFPQFFTLKSRIWQWQMNYAYEARTSDRVIAVSNNTKRDMVKYWHINPSQIEVIYEGVDKNYFNSPDEKLFAELKQRWKLSEQYIYFVGSVEPRKNLITVVRALHQLRSQNNDTIKLVVSGGKSWLTSELYQTITDLGFTGRCYLHRSGKRG
jgi:glycosyltransferase involved in cell wall biosynthesis